MACFSLLMPANMLLAEKKEKNNRAWVIHADVSLTHSTTHLPH